MGTRRLRRSPWKVSIPIAAVVLAVLLLLVQNSTVVVPEMDSYALVTPRTIAVKVFVAACSWTRVTGVAESPTTVKVTVETLPCPMVGAGTAALDARELRVSLNADLGARSVEDAGGHALPLR